MLLYIWIVWIDRFSRAGDPNFIRDMRTSHRTVLVESGEVGG
jgi:hypothetical protein